MAATRTSPKARNRPFSLIVAVVAAIVLVTISAAAAERNSSNITFVAPTSGQTLSGPVKWEVGVAEKANATDVEFYVDDQQTPLWVEQRPPFVFGGDLGVLDTTKLSNGAHVLRVRVLTPGRDVDTASITVQIQNGSAPPPPTTTSPPPPTTTSPPPPPSAPQVSIVTPTGGQTVSGGVRWEAGVPSGTSVGAIEFFVDGASSPAWSEQVAPYVYNGDAGVLDTKTLSNGAHQLRVRLVTSGGATSSATVSVNVANGTATTPPPTPPAAPVISSAPPATTTSTSASFAFATSTSGATLQCSLDGAALATCTSPRAYSSLAVGQHTFGVRAVAGGVSSSVTSHTWRVDSTTTAPTTTACTGTQWKADYYANMSLSNSPTVQRCDDRIDNEWGDNSPASAIPVDRFSARWTGTFAFPGGATRFTVTGDDGLRLKIDGTVVLDRWVDQPPTTYTVDRTLTQGSHQVTLEYFENGVNATAKLGWAPLSSIVAATPTITTSPSNPTTSTNANFAYSSTTAGATYQCSRDGSAFQACGSSISYTGLTVGSHTFSVRALAGTSTSSPATYTWQVNATAAIATGSWLTWSRVSDIPDLHDGDRGRLADVSLPVMPPGSSSVIRANVSDMLDSSGGGDGSYGTTGNRNEPWAREGTDTWISMWMLIPNGSDSRFPGAWRHAPISSGWNTFLEFHEPGIAPRSTHFGAWGSDPPVLQMSHAAGSPSSPTDRWVRDTQPIVYNQWQRWVIHIYWHRTSGYIEWWVDDRQIVGRQSRTVVPSGGTADTYPTLWNVNGVPTAGYFQMGHYRGPSRTDQDTTYHSRITVGPTRASVGG